MRTPTRAQLAKELRAANVQIASAGQVVNDIESRFEAQRKRLVACESAHASLVAESAKRAEEYARH